MCKYKYITIFLVILLTISLTINISLTVSYLENRQLLINNTNITVGSLNLSYDNSTPWKHYGLLGVYLGDLPTNNDTSDWGSSITLGNYYEKTITVVNTGTLCCDVFINFSQNTDSQLLNLLDISTTITSDKTVQTLTNNSKWKVLNLKPGEKIKIKCKISVLLSINLGSPAYSNIYYDIFAVQPNYAYSDDLISYAFLQSILNIKNKIKIG